MSEKMEYGLNAPAMEYDGANKYLRITDIDEETREFTKTNLTSPRINLSESAQYLLAKKDILFARTGASVGKTYCYREEDGDVYFAGFLIRARIKNTFDEEFIFQYTLTKMYSDYINVISQRSGQPGVNANEYSNLSILTPNLSEQEKIGLMHRKIDSLISLHQRKLDNVKMLKKSLLQKLFPKDGEKIPELRFPGFTDAWEQRKVGDFLTESRVKGSNGMVSKKLTVKLWGKGVVEKNTIYRGSEATQYYTRFSGQFIYGKLDFLNQAFGIIPEELDGYESTLDSPAFDVSPALNKDFFLDYVSREQFYLVQGIIANGSRKAKRIHSDTFFEMPILLPEFNEQKTISDFTSKFDTLISLHQRQSNFIKISYLF